MITRLLGYGRNLWVALIVAAILGAFAGCLLAVISG